MELSTYLERLNALRSELFKTLEGLDAQALNWTPLPQETNSLFVLATHSLGAEQGWIAEVIGGVPPTRVRAKEFLAHGNDVNELRERFEVVAHESETVLLALAETDLNQTRAREPYGTVTVRWIIIHVIEHYAEHLGQIQLTRQLWENRKVRTLEG